MKKIALFGECVIRLNLIQENTYQQVFSGNSLNMAKTIKDILKDKVNVEYISVFGEDSVSTNIIDFLHEKSIQTNYSQIHINKKPTIQMNNSQTKTLPAYLNNEYKGMDIFNKEASSELLKGLEDFDLIYFSLNFLMTLSKNGRASFFKLIKKLRMTGIEIIYDSLSIENVHKFDDEVRSLYETSINYADVVITSIFDETTLWGNKDINKTLYKLYSSGCSEVIINSNEEIDFYSKANNQKAINIKKGICNDSVLGAYFASKVLNGSMELSLKDVSKFISNCDTTLQEVTI